MSEGGAPPNAGARENEGPAPGAPRLNGLARSIGASATMRAASAASARPDTISLAVGEPGDPPPPEAVEAARAALRTERWGYGPIEGLAPLREALARDQTKKSGFTVEPEQLLVTAGGKQASHDALRCMLEPGDEVLVLAPYWPSFLQQVRWCGGTPVVVPPGPGLLPDPAAVEAAVTPRTRVLIVNSPSNPLSAVFAPELLTELAAVARRHGLWVIADQVYHDLALDEPARALLSVAPDLRAQTVVIESFSKRFAMPAMRLGCAVAEPGLLAAMRSLASATTTHASLPAQRAGLAALEGDPAWAEQQKARYRRRRQQLLEALQDIPGLLLRRPQSAFYLFLGVQQWCLHAGRPADDEALAQDLLQQAGVAVTPGTAFGAPGNLRLSFGAQDELLAEAVRRLKRYFLRS